MTYDLSILPRAMKELHRISLVDRRRIERAIEKLASEPRPAGSSKLKARNGWRIRIGVYRVIYEIEDGQEQIVVLHVGHRRDVYE